MASLADRYTLARDETFLEKVQVQIVAFAKIVLEESASTANHGERVALARKVLVDSTSMAHTFAMLVVSDPAVQPRAPSGAALTDAELDGAVQYAWNAEAGVATA